jgi:hypothetical protein
MRPPMQHSCPQSWFPPSSLPVTPARFVLPRAHVQPQGRASVLAVSSPFAVRQSPAAAIVAGLLVFFFYTRPVSQSIYRLRSPPNEPS